MKRIVTLTAFAACLALSGTAYAHGLKASSGGHADSGAIVWGQYGSGSSHQSVYTSSSSYFGGVKTSTKASSESSGWVKNGTLMVGGEAGAGSRVGY